MFWIWLFHFLSLLECVEIFSYVDSVAGNNTGLCDNRDSPCKTLDYAWSQLKHDSSETIVILRDYSMNGYNFNWQTNQKITIKSESGDGDVELDISDGSFAIASPWATLKGLTIKSNSQNCFFNGPQINIKGSFEDLTFNFAKTIQCIGKFVSTLALNTKFELDDVNNNVRGSRVFLSIDQYRSCDFSGFSENFSIFDAGKLNFEGGTFHSMYISPYPPTANYTDVTFMGDGTTVYLTTGDYLFRDCTFKNIKLKNQLFVSASYQVNATFIGCRFQSIDNANALIRGFEESGITIIDTVIKNVQAGPQMIAVDGKNSILVLNGVTFEGNTQSGGSCQLLWIGKGVKSVDVENCKFLEADDFYWFLTCRADWFLEIEWKNNEITPFIWGTDCDDTCIVDRQLCKEYFGSITHDWNDNGGIGKKAKLTILWVNLGVFGGICGLCCLCCVVICIAICISETIKQKAHEADYEEIPE